jgi:purine-nucleoside phosphorylase
MDGTSMDMYTESADFLRGNTPEALQKPKIAIICGSGLGGLAGTVDNEGKVELDYGSIPHFSRSAGKTATLLTNPFSCLTEVTSI